MEPVSFEQFKSLRRQGLTVDQIEKFEKGWTPQAQSGEELSQQKNKLHPTFNSEVKPNADLAIGVAKGALSTLTNISKAGQWVYNKITGRKEPLVGAEDIVPGSTTPEGEVQKTGFKTEQIGEYFLPIAPAKVGLKAPKVVNFLMNMALQGSDAAVKTSLQGGKVPDIIMSSIFGASTPVIGGVANVATKKIPEALYNQIFKATSDDFLNYVKSIAKGKNVNPTLAKELLDRNLKGSAESMAILAVNKLDDLEKQVQNLAIDKKLAGNKIRISDKQLKGYKELISSMAGELQGFYFSANPKEGQILLSKLENEGVNLTPTTALRIKRFIDKTRNLSSFKLDAKLNPKQGEYKAAADLMREKIHQAGFSNLMNEERIYIEAIDNLVDNAVSSKNRKLLGLTDYILGGGGLASGYGVGGVGAAAMIRGFQQPFTLTNLAQGLNKLGIIAEKGQPFTRQIPKAVGGSLFQIKK